MDDSRLISSSTVVGCTRPRQLVNRARSNNRGGTSLVRPPVSDQFRRKPRIPFDWDSCFNDRASVRVARIFAK